MKKMVYTIKGFSNSRSEGHGEFMKKIGILRERRIDCRMLPTSGPYILKIDGDDGAQSYCCGVTQVRFALDVLLGESEV